MTSSVLLLGLKTIECLAAASDSTPSVGLSSIASTPPAALSRTASTPSVGLSSIASTPPVGLSRTASTIDSATVSSTTTSPPSSAALSVIASTIDSATVSSTTTSPTLSAISSASSIFRASPALTSQVLIKFFQLVSDLDKKFRSVFFPVFPVRQRFLVFFELLQLLLLEFNRFDKIFSANF